MRTTTFSLAMIFAVTVLAGVDKGLAQTDSVQATDIERDVELEFSPLGTITYCLLLLIYQ